jgi:hypothetical protein
MDSILDAINASDLVKYLAQRPFTLLLYLEHFERGMSLVKAQLLHLERLYLPHDGIVLILELLLAHQPNASLPLVFGLGPCACHLVCILNLPQFLICLRLQLLNATIHLDDTLLYDLIV